MTEPGVPRGKRRPAYTYSEGRYVPIERDWVQPAAAPVPDPMPTVEIPPGEVPRRPGRPIWWSYVLTAVIALAVGIAIGQNGLARPTEVATGPPREDVGAGQPAQDGRALVAALAQVVTTMQPGTVFSADTDPNGLLGQPNTYTSKASFTDTRIDPGSVLGQEAWDIEPGGSVEVFDDPALATARRDLIQSVSEALPRSSEFDFVSGRVLLRVSWLLTPEQAADYQAALVTVVG